MRSTLFLFLSLFQRLFLFLFLFPSLVFTQSIQTDRPDQTECAYIVPQACLQIETGVMLNRISNTEREFAHPAFLLRYGINKFFEFRYECEAGTMISGNKKVTGFKSPAVGMKIHIAEEKKWIPQSLLIFHLNLPGFAQTDLRDSILLPDFRFSISKGITDKFSLGSNIGMEWESAQIHPTPIYTFVAGFSLCDRLGCFLELFGGFPSFNSGDHNFDGGFTFLLNENLQLDASGGMKFGTKAKDWFISSGISFRCFNPLSRTYKERRNAWKD